MRPVGHGPDLPVPILSDFDDEILPMSFDASSDAYVKHDNEFQCMETSQCQRFIQFQLNDLVRDLGLTKEKAKLLGSRLKEKNMLEAGTTICSYRKRECDFTKFFDQHNDLVLCTDICGLMNEFGIDYKKEA